MTIAGRRGLACCVFCAPDVCSLCSSSIHLLFVLFGAPAALSAFRQIPFGPLFPLFVPYTPEGSYIKPLWHSILLPATAPSPWLAPHGRSYFDPSRRARMPVRMGPKCLLQLRPRPVPRGGPNAGAGLHPAQPPALGKDGLNQLPSIPPLSSVVPWMVPYFSQAADKRPVSQRNS